MPVLPNLTAAETSRDVTDTFYGYNHRMKIAPGEFYDMQNLSSRDYPMLSVRQPRGTVKLLTRPQGMLAKNVLCVVDNGTLYVDGEATALTGLTEGEKQMVSMGAYICIWPDKKFYNTADPTDYGSMEKKYSSSGTVRYQICTLTGDPYEDYTASPLAPENPENLDYWFDKTTGSLKQYNANTESWTSIATVYTRITFLSDQTKGTFIKHFRQFDSVSITGTPFEELNGTKYLYDVGTDADGFDYMIVIGLIDSYTQNDDVICVDRSVPELDYVCECQNRLWGCFYGSDEENGNLNELYCCKLGDFRNWRVYQGLSTDSWTASVGSDGPWTGAVNYMGYPTFFKEDRIHRISVSSTGAHSVSETVCRGVQKGSSKSLAVVNETLFYKSRSDVCAYQGGFPETVSANLGDRVFTDSVAGSIGDSYYISMLCDGEWSLFVYDTTNNLWTRQDSLHVMDFAQVGDDLYAINADDRHLLALLGTDGRSEDRIDWYAQTGILYYEYPDRKYVQRYEIRMSAATGVNVSIEIRYDSEGPWYHYGTHRFKGTNTILFPVRPRRCDHMELRISGDGPVKIFSICRTLEQGSDVI